jgi:hypothetical protein
MKKLLLLFAFLLPLTMMAHEGHGISGSGLIHLLISHYYVAIGFALVVVGIAMYLRRIKIKR